MLNQEEINNWNEGYMRSYNNDIEEMHQKFGVHTWLETATEAQKKELMKLRMRMLTEEFAETMNAYLQGDAEETIDGLIDIIVISIGTLDICGVDADRAWSEIFAANMSKEVGKKPGRPNPLGLPDLIKPAKWVGPDHGDNHGQLKEFL